jgi:predicted nucleic acid-binding protein
MNGDRAFFDTNVLVYLYSDHETDKQNKAFAEFNKSERFVSTQVLTEFCNICLKKLHFPASEIGNALLEISEACNVIIVDDSDLRQALSIQDRYKYSYYDSLVIESALAAGCNLLFTEDMQDGQLIEGVLTIKNIFKD